MEVPDDLLYTTDHEWVKVAENIITVGITDYAQSHLGDVVFIELPEDDTIVSKSEIAGSIESVKTVSDIYCPVDGKVVEANKALEDNPALLNTDPYGDGWVYRLEIDPADLDQAGLMNTEAYKKHVDEQ